MSLKTYMLKHFAKVKVVHRIPGRLRLKVPKQVHVPEESREYDQLVVRGIKLLKGIEEIQFNYVLGTILVTYDTNQVYEEKVLKWIKRFMDVVVDNLALIEQYGQHQLDYVISTIEQQLKEEVSKV